MQPEYFPIRAGVTAEVDYLINTVKVFAGKLIATYRFSQGITIQNIIDIKKDYEENHVEEDHSSKL